ncbi:hypothetical protein CASFOL_021467 [Castilleja foliolosa]|uniref:Uncharacterized protein n=1 Tax=Castilleja foliolosa TaxID=1961234 RepID=A0ABD3CXH2_9LAMI
MSIFKVTPKCISITKEAWLNSNAWICRGFVSASMPSQQAAKVDKDTCAKIIEAADTVKDGTKEVVSEVKRVTGKVASVSGKMVADVANKGFEKASETAETKKSKDVLDTAKAATEAFKERVEKEKD